MPVIKKYLTVNAHGDDAITKLNEEINRLIAYGWQPLGAVTSSAITDPDNIWETSRVVLSLTQTMVNYEK